MIVIKDKSKELLVKGTIVLGATFGILFVLVIPIFMGVYGYSESSFIYKLWILDFILFIVSGIVMMVLMVTLKPKPKLKPQAAEKLSLPIDTYDDFMSLLRLPIHQQDYKDQGVIYAGDQTEVLLFTRQKFWSLGCISIIRVTEMTSETLDLFDETLKEFLKKYYGKDRITDEISLITLVCVDRITPSFQKFVNSNIEQSFKNYRLPVGVSFGDKSIYIAKQKDGFAVTQYKKLRKRFLNLLPKAM